MEFTLDTVNVEYRNVDLVRYPTYRDRNRMILRFYFYTDLFTSMGILSRLKLVPGFMNFIKGHMHTAINDMSNIMFENAKESINSCSIMQNYDPHYHGNRKNVMRMRYSNSYKFEDRPVIAYEDSLDGWCHRIETREDLISAMMRITPQFISK